MEHDRTVVADVEQLHGWLSEGMLMERRRLRAADRVRVMLHWRAVPRYRPGLIRIVGLDSYRGCSCTTPIARLRATLPFGWTYERICDRYAVRVGPWWLLGPRILWHRVGWWYTLRQLKLSE